MKAKFEKTVVLDAIGVLDKDDAGRYVLVVEDTSESAESSPAPVPQESN